MMVSMTLFGILVIVLTILISMTLHEAMHAFASNWLGDDTARLQGRLTLNPLAHIDPIGTILLPATLILFSILSGQLLPIFGAAKPVPFNPLRVKYEEWGAALVALAGPTTNLLLAAIAGLSLRVINSDTIIAELLTTFIFVNLGFFVFNMIPIPPLDGSRILYAIAPKTIRQFMREVERYSLMAVFFLVFFAQDFLSLIMINSINFFFQIFVGQPIL
jgi:Zn-dependent protease